MTIYTDTTAPTPEQVSTGQDVANAINESQEKLKVINPLQDLPVWREALAKAKAGEKSAKLCMIGDSTFTGSGSTGVAGYPENGRTTGTLKQLAKVIRETGVSVNTDSSFGTANVSSYFSWDNRTSLPAGWEISDINGVFCHLWKSVGASSTLEVATETEIDTVIIHFLHTNSTRNLEVDIDGSGSPVTINAGGLDDGIMDSVTIPTSLGLHTIQLTGVTGDVYIAGIEAFDSTKGINLVQFTRSGGNYSDLNQSFRPWSGKEMLSGVEADLYIVNLCINSWNQGVTLSDYLDEMTTAITFLKSLGSDVVLVTGVPTVDGHNDGNASLANQRAIAEAVIQFGKDNDIPVFDTHARFGSREQSNSYYTDYTHLKSFGYYDFMSSLRSLFV